MEEFEKVYMSMILQIFCESSKVEDIKEVVRKGTARFVAKCDVSYEPELAKALLEWSEKASEAFLEQAFKYKSLN